MLAWQLDALMLFTGHDFFDVLHMLTAGFKRWRKPTLLNANCDFPYLKFCQNRRCFGFDIPYVATTLRYVIRHFGFELAVTHKYN